MVYFETVYKHEGNALGIVVLILMSLGKSIRILNMQQGSDQ